MLEHVNREDELNIGAHCACHLISLAFAMTRGNQWDSKYVQGKHVMSMIDFPFELEFALNTERRQGHTKRHEWQGTLQRPLSYHFSELANHLHCKQWHRRK